MKKVSIVIPVYNEEKYIEKVIKKVIKANTLRLRKEIIIINDGSKDKTKENIIKEILKLQKKINRKETTLKIKTKKFDLIIINKRKNEGKGEALRTGLKNTTGDIFIIQDADLEYDPSDYPNLLLPIIKNRADAVYGSRTKGIKKFGNKFSGLKFYLGGRTLTLIINILFGLNLTDQPTGYKLFNKTVSQKLLKESKEKDFSFEVEITAIIAKHHFRIKEVPINYSPRSVKEGKKIKFKDFIKSVFIAVKYSIIALSD